MYRYLYGCLRLMKVISRNRAGDNQEEQRNRSGIKRVGRGNPNKAHSVEEMRLEKWKRNERSAAGEVYTPFLIMIPKP